jgi:hypothetical protein
VPKKIVKPRVVVTKRGLAPGRKLPVVKLIVQDPEPVLEVHVHDPTFLERAAKWVREVFE